MGSNKGLLGLVIGLGVLILAGLIVVVSTLANRFSAPPAPVMSAVTLGEPAGTRVTGLVAAGDRLAVLLQGGGASDRIVLLDPQDGSRVGTVSVSGPAGLAGGRPVQ